MSRSPLAESPLCSFCIVFPDSQERAVGRQVSKSKVPWLRADWPWSPLNYGSQLLAAPLSGPHSHSHCRGILAEDTHCGEALGKWQKVIGPHSVLTAAVNSHTVGCTRVLPASRHCNEMLGERKGLLWFQSMIKRAQGLSGTPQWGRVAEYPGPASAGRK